MPLRRSTLPAGRLLGLLDALVVLWVALWIVLALAVAGEMRNLGRPEHDRRPRRRRCGAGG